MRTAGIGLVCAIAVLLAPPSIRGHAVARADSTITITSAPMPKNGFPKEAVFSVDAASSAGNITDVRLFYFFQPSTLGSSKKLDIDIGKQVHAEYHMLTASNPYVPPSKVIRYYWEVSDAAGNTVKTDPVDWLYADTLHPFKSVNSGHLTLYYYNGSESNANKLVELGRIALEKAAALDGVTFDFDVHLVMYATQADIRPALSFEAASQEGLILGQAHAPNVVILVAGDLTGGDNEDTVRHELTHLINADATSSGALSAQAKLPLWLDEGLAVYSQNDPGGFKTVVDRAVSNNTVVPIRTLAPSFRGSNSDLFYGESWSIAKFLVTTYGGDKFKQLLTVFKSSISDEDSAFMTVYGLNRDGIYNAWRQSVGLKPVAGQAPAQPSGSAGPASQPRSSATDAGAQQPAATSAATSARPAATRPVAPTVASAPTQPAAVPKPAQSSTTSSDSKNTVTMIVLGVAGGALFLAVLAGAVIGGLALSRRGR